MGGSLAGVRSARLVARQTRTLAIKDVEVLTRHLQTTLKLRPEESDEWLQVLPALLDKAGVEIAFSVPGIEFSHNAGTGVREAAGLAVAHGLPWAEALKALTVNAAAIWGIGGHYGALRPGMDGDVDIWNGDPLQPSSAPIEVLVRGASVSLETRQDALARRYAPAMATDPWPADYH